MLAPSEVLLDVGCGDGLIAFGALERVGEQGKIIFSDISQDLLDYCQFLRASADDFSALESTSVDVVTTRSVLIYVKAKQQAFHEFFRVLKPNGRLSIFEPINRFCYPEPPHLFDGYDVTPIEALAHKVRAVYERIHPLESSPMVDFDERDLLTFAEKAGFAEIHLDLQIEIEQPQPINYADDTQKPRWETFVRSAGNPLDPTLEEAMAQVLTPHETEQFTIYLRPLVETNQRRKREALAYLWAVKH